MNTKNTIIFILFLFNTISCTFLHMDEVDKSNFLRTNPYDVNGDGPVKGSIAKFYISTNGSDNNSGIEKDKPALTIQNVLTNFKNAYSVEIYLAEGRYIKGKGLKNSGDRGLYIERSNVTLSGGWNIDFTQKVGISILDAQSNYGVISILCDYVTIDSNVHICCGKSYQDGGGIRILGMYNTISAIIYSNHVVNVYGGGVFLDGGTNGAFGKNLINGRIFHNFTESYGGGVCNFQKSNTINGIICSNNATMGGGGVFIQNEAMPTYLNGFYFNNTPNNVYTN